MSKDLGRPKWMEWKKLAALYVGAGWSHMGLKYMCPICGHKFTVLPYGHCFVSMVSDGKGG